MDADIAKEVRRAVDTGKVFYGAKEANKKILKDNVKIIILSSNIDSEAKDYIKNNAKLKKIPLYEADLPAVELGSLCGKPFSANALAIADLGDSNLLSVIGAKK